MATIERRTTDAGDVRWKMRVFLGRDPATGKRRFVDRTFETQKEAKVEARRLERMKDQGALTSSPSRESVARYVRRWLDDVMRGRIRARTWADYCGVWERYVEKAPTSAPPIAATRLDRLSPEAIQSLYGWLVERGLSPRTVRSLHAVLRQALEYAARTGAIGRNAADLVVLPKQDRREVHAMSSHEACRFLEAARADRHYALWCVLLGGALRPSEALALKWTDVDLDASRIHVQRTLTRRGQTAAWALVEPKTARGRRVVVLPGFAVQSLRESRVRQAKERLQLGREYQDHGFVFTTEFGAPLDLHNLNVRNFRRIMEAAELGTWGEQPPQPARGPRPRRPFVPAYRLYDLRHSAATLLLRAGAHPKVVSERLGHSSIAFTLDVYSASLPDMQEDAAQKLDEMLNRTA